MSLAGYLQQAYCNANFFFSQSMISIQVIRTKRGLGYFLEASLALAFIAILFQISSRRLTYRPIPSKIY